MTESLLRYYKNALLLDDLLKMEIAEEDLYYGEKKIPEEFSYLAYGVSNFFAENTFVNFVINSIDEYNRKLEEAKSKKATNEPEYPYEFMYAPFLIKKTVLNKEKNENEVFNYPIFLINISHEKVIDLIKSVPLKSSETTDKLFQGKFLFHPFSIIPELNCTKEKYIQEFMLELEKQSMNEHSPTFEHLLYKMLTFVNSFTGADITYDPLDGRTIHERCIELIQTLESYYESSSGLEYQEIKIFKEPWIIAKTKNDVDYTRGLMNVYNSIEANGINEQNILVSILKGNKYQISSVPYENETEDSSTVILDKEKLITYLGQQKGAFAKDNDLTYSQKYALAMSKRYFDVTAVNGPPGTGKTSLLRALIGDIAVENALKAFAAYKKGVKNIPFATPIVSFSTNNKALENIVEGINQAFSSTYSLAKEKDPKKAILYKRWIDLEFAFFKDKERVSTTINDADLYVPFIKNGTSYNGQNPKAPLYFFDLKSKYGLKRFVFELGKNFFQYLDAWLLNYIKFANNEKLKESAIGALEKDKLLHYIIGDLERRLRQNNTHIKMTTLSILDIMAQKRECKPVVDKLYECLGMPAPIDPIVSRESFDIHLLFIQNQIDYLEQSIELITSNIEKKKKDYNEEKSKIREDLIKQMSRHNALADKAVQKVADQIEEENTNITKKHKENITMLEEKIADVKKSISASLWGKIKTFLVDNLNIEKLVDERIVEFENTIREITQSFENEILQSKSNLTLKIQDIETERKKQIESSNQQALNSVELLNNILKQQIQKEFDEFKEITGGDEISDVLQRIKEGKNILEQVSNVEYFFIDEFEEKYKTYFAGFDTGIRTENFFLAWHLLEALLLTEFMRKSKIKTKQENECFACGQKSLTRQEASQDKASYYCSSCNARFINNNVKDIGRPLNENEIKQILIQGYVTIDNQAYVLARNESGPFWNVAKPGMAAVNNSDTEQSFRYASVFFPIINTTCHSFGSVFNINQDSTVPEGFIDTLFMDESGMILVPFLVNLYAGKRVILFGDEKQIEPVYPFKNHKLICNNVLIDIYGKDAEEKDTMRNRMSVISRTSMSLANDASYFKNPYIQNNLPGDIWLREHFRCRKSIIDFCNQHIYSGYMLPFKKDEENENIKHLYTYNHDFKQDTSGTGRVNKAEVEHILDFIEKGIENKIASSDTLTHADMCKTIGIITPYAEQEKLFNTQIRKRSKLKGLAAGTVHKFQGSERDMIIFSSTIGPNTSNVGNLFFNRDDFNIINVAVSRAKETFVLFGNHARINEAPLSYIGLLLEHIRQNGKILEVRTKGTEE